MPLAVADIIAATSDLLMDPDFSRWPVAERIRWGNEAMGAILTRRPAAFTTSTVIALVGGTFQTIPSGSAMFIDLVRNMAPDGTTPGGTIRRSDRQQLDDADPDWHFGTAKARIQQYVFDDRMPTAFYVYPPAIAGTKAELWHAPLPTKVAEDDEDGSFGIGAEYLEAVVNYVCYRCKAKDSEEGSPTDAIGFYQAFETALGIKAASQSANSPNQLQNSV